MRKTILLAAAIAAVAAPSAVLAADKKADDAKVVPGNTAEDIQRGVVIVRSFVGALNSDQVTKEQKGALIACLYNNPVRKISLAAGKVLSENEKLDPKNPNHIYAASAAVCGMPKGNPAPAKTDPSKGR
ncbi:hypothetical protein MB02_04735 [Croceicoccus estronivorus]|uniref:hypothetical protein n=1 Tax=Croceicoccus estronivorus TaxID=1172626 RepID=UPI00082D4BBE|nr:hypothetical protein [Croceicoccus estronivorus]OCC24781.1 hypothetical protein MB02_04735 [Croceicoccus estronivorus]